VGYAVGKVVNSLVAESAFPFGLVTDGENLAGEEIPALRAGTRVAGSTSPALEHRIVPLDGLVYTLLNGLGNLFGSGRFVHIIAPAQDMNYPPKSESHLRRTAHTISLYILFALGPTVYGEIPSFTRWEHPTVRGKIKSPLLR
jgi:hypothetical protein